MEALLLSFVIVATSETGDKTQLIALCLAARFCKPVPVLLGILSATLVSNLAACILGQYIGIWLQGNVLHGLLSASFIAAAIWSLIPDKIEDCPEPPHSHGIFLATFTTFLLAEMGDKTQLAAIVLAAQFHSVFWVTLGTTLGMMVINIPTVLLGNKIMAKIPLKLVRLASGAIFAALGIYELSRLL